jgi:hypothetical protein
MRLCISLLLCLAPLAIFGQDGELEARQPLPNLPMDPPPQLTATPPIQRSILSGRPISSAAPTEHASSTIGVPDRPSPSSTSVDTETRHEQTAVTTVAASSGTEVAVKTLTVTELAQAASPPATDVCWNNTGSKSCQQILKDFSKCYDYTGNMTDPNGDDGRSETYQRCLCVNVEGDVYKKYASPTFHFLRPQSSLHPLTQC